MQRSWRDADQATSSRRPARAIAGLARKGPRPRPAFQNDDAHLHLIRARRDEVGAAERRQEVVERFLVREVDDAEPHAHLGLVAVEQVVDAEAEIEQMARRNSRRIGHIVFRAVRRDHDAAWRRGSAKQQLVIGASSVANVLPQYRPIAACWSAVERQRRRVVGHRARRRGPSRTAS